MLGMPGGAERRGGLNRHHGGDKGESGRDGDEAAGCDVFQHFESFHLSACLGWVWPGGPTSVQYD